MGAALDLCRYCGERIRHYLCHICPNCSCHYSEVRDAMEPHIAYPPDMEPNPDCSIHGWSTESHAR